MPELLIASAAAIVVTFAGFSFARSFMQSQKRVANAEDARGEAKDLLGRVKKAIDARMIQTGDDPVVFTTAFSSPGSPFAGCGATPVACGNLNVRHTNLALGTVKRVRFETRCVDFESANERIDYANIGALAGRFACPSNSRRPVVDYIVTPNEADATNPPEQITNYPRGSVVGAFLCSRLCGGEVWVQASMIYRQVRPGQSDDVGYSVVSESATFALNDRNANIEILPP